MTENPVRTIPLVIGTRNRKKGVEMAQLILPPWESNPRLERLDVRSLADFPEVPDVIEDADTFEGNARKKASEVAIAIRSWVLADDSGLSVDALKGAPGVFSARYAGEPTDDEANNDKLIRELASVREPNRTASYICYLALADPTGAVRLEAKGTCRGLILSERKGKQGFGYDPLFLIPEYHQTFGELSALAKHQISHRARAFGHFRLGLDRLIATGGMDSA